MKKPISPAKPVELMSIPDYARSKGIGPQAMRIKLKRLGMRGLIDPAIADQRLADAQSAREKANDTQSTSYSEADRRHKWAKATQEELKLKKIEGTLVLKSVVEKSWFDQTRRARDRMENIPARVSGLCAACGGDQAKIFALLVKEIHQALEDLSR